VRGWGRDGLGTGAGKEREGARGVDVDYALRSGRKSVDTLVVALCLGGGRGCGSGERTFVLSTLSSKVEILETYLNTVYLGQDGPTAIYGVGASAARAGSKLARRGLMLAVIG
jgi:hypothetical protein